MADIHCTVEDLAVSMELIIKEYGEKITETTTKVIKEAGKVALDKVTELSPERTGAYKKSWRLTTNPQDAETPLTGKNAGFARVYNLQYALTHLLEKGHQLRRNGQWIGHADARPHIGPAQEYAEEWLERELKNKLER